MYIIWLSNQAKSQAKRQRVCFYLNLEIWHFIIIDMFKLQLLIYLSIKSLSFERYNLLTAMCFHTNLNTRNSVYSMNLAALDLHVNFTFVYFLRSVWKFQSIWKVTISVLHKISKGIRSLCLIIPKLAHVFVRHK